MCKILSLYHKEKKMMVMFTPGHCYSVCVLSCFGLTGGERLPRTPWASRPEGIPGS